MPFLGLEPQPDFDSSNALADQIYHGETPGDVSRYVMTIAENPSGRLHHAVYNTMLLGTSYYRQATGEQIMRLFDDYSFRTPTIGYSDHMLAPAMLEAFGGDIHRLTDHRWPEHGVEVAAPSRWYDILTDAQTGAINAGDPTEAERATYEHWRKVFEAAFAERKSAAESLVELRPSLDDATEVMDRVPGLARRGRRRFTTAGVALGAVAGVLMARQNPDLAAEIAGGSAGAVSFGFGSYLAASKNMRLQFFLARGGARRAVRNARNMDIIDGQSPDA